MSKKNNVEKVDTISQLVSILRKDNGDDGQPFWYRGHADKDWSLLSSFNRLETDVTESTLLTKFKQDAYLLMSDKPRDDFEWLFWLQHYGVPTRLLDWTESPLVGLYFAVADKEYEQSDAALWRLNPSALNGHAGITEDERHYIPSFEEKAYLDNYSVESISNGPAIQLNPIAALATRSNPRIQAQSGTFTISHMGKEGIEEIEDGSHVKKYIIPKECKRDILKELELLGFNKFQMFPELASIGERIRDYLA